ncbi:MAG TPA: TlpA disulfide reductase family protein [Tepidisphaeraceae bacterium]|nr:TlpA disulfide reductase family protein [Tepidisphaeraceae bacterium]
MTILRPALKKKPPERTYTNTSANRSGQLKIRVLDPEGRAVTGAQIGVWGFWGDRFPDFPHSHFSEPDGKDYAVSSDDKGEAVVTAASVFASRYRVENEPIAQLFVLDEPLGLAALEPVRNSEFASGKVHEIHLKPACRITGELTCLGLDEAGQTLVHGNGMIFPPGQFRLHSLHSEFNGPRFEFVVPPGDYQITARASKTYSPFRCVRIEPGQRTLKLQLNVEPYATTRLFGHPAPELRHIKGWKNTGPLRLSDLHGKLVLLDFWGYWCGPCVGAMPALTKFYDELKDRGLVVIGVHDDSVASIQEMDAKLAQDRAKFWGGRDLPFPIALDGGGPTRIMYTTITARGATTAEYGIVSFPTTLVIGRDGKVLREIDVRDADARKQIETLLGNSAGEK